MKSIKDLWDALIAWLNDDGISDTKVVPQRFEPLGDVGSFESWE